MSWVVSFVSDACENHPCTYLFYRLVLVLIRLSSREFYRLQGREILQSTVDLVQNKLNLEVRSPEPDTNPIRIRYESDSDWEQHRLESDFGSVCVCGSGDLRRHGLHHDPHRDGLYGGRGTHRSTRKKRGGMGETSV